MRSDQTGALEFQDAGFGMAVVSQQASAVGVTAVPTPTTDDDSDLWFVYERMFNTFTFVTGVGFQSNIGIERLIDSKAMRKVDDGNDVIAVVESGSGSAGLTISSHFRFLVKLH